MRSSVVVFACLSVSAVVGVAACSSSGTEPTASTTLPLGRFVFVLDESAVRSRIEASCAKEADPKACLAAIHEEAAREGIRLAVDREGNVVWTSYVYLADGTETIDLEATLAPKWDGVALTGEPIGALTGVHAEGASLQGFRIERVDERTIAMLDPRKGRLVFRKPQ